MVFSRWKLRAVELTTGSATVAADLLIDLRKCFEYLSRDLLWKDCHDHGYPMHVARMSMQVATNVALRRV